MLVQFMVKNVLSFKEETVLDMTAIKAYKEHWNERKISESCSYLWSKCKWKVKFIYGNVSFSKNYYGIS